MTTGNHDGFSKAGNQDLSVSRDGLNEAAALELTERQVAEMFDANPAVAEAGLDGQAAPHQLAANHAAGKNTRPAPSAAKKHKNGNDEDADREPEDARDELMQLASLEDTVTDTDTADDGEAEEAVDVGGNDGEGSGFGGVGAALLGVGVIGGGIAAAAGSSGSDTPPAGGADHDDDDNDNDNDDDSDEIVLDNDEDTDIPDSIETDAEQVVLRLDGTDGADTFIIAAPNATSITLRGSVRGANDQIVFTIADADPDAGDIRTITVISELEEESGNTLVFDFGDAKDTVVLSPDSVIRGFSTIEVRSGTLDISGTDFADSIDIIVNSGIVLNLEQFLQTNSVASITDLGKLTITLANEGELTALQNYLAGEGKEKILIGIEVTVQIGDGDPIADEELDALLDAINYPGIPALSDAVDALRTQLQDVLEAMDAGFATVADELTGLNTELARIDDAIAALEAGSNAANEELLEELAAVKGELGELIATEISAIRTEILGVENAEDLNYATLAALNEAIAALEGFVSGYAETEGTLAYELAALRSEFEIAIANEINELRLELLGVVDAGDLNYATLKALNDAIAVLEGFVTGDAETEGTLAYEIAALRSDFETAIANEIDGLRSELLGVIHADELDYGTLKALNDAVKVFEDFVTGDAETLGTLANQIAGLREDIETVIADEVDALREEILGVKDADDLDYPTLAALNNAILELESIINGDAETEGSLANQIADLQRQIDELIASLEDLTSPPLETWSGDMLELQASQIFKSGWYHADLPGDLTKADVLVGMLFAEGTTDPVGIVMLSSFDIGDRYEVPEGCVYLSFMGATLVETAVELAGGDIAQALLAKWGTLAGQSISLENAVISDQGAPVLVNVDEFDRFYADARDAGILGGLAGYENVDGYLQGFAQTVLLTPNDVRGSAEFVSYFLNGISGYDLATIPLEIEGPLSVAQAVALAELGFDLKTKVDFSVRDSFATLQAALSSPERKAVLEAADLVIATGNELDNAMDFHAFGPDINLRIEAGDGKDFINAGRGDDVIVGGRGGDIINLTHLDGSADQIVYRDVRDGGTDPMTRIYLPKDPDYYREGSTIQIMVNGESYSYTITADDVAEGDPMGVAVSAIAEAISEGDCGLRSVEAQPGGVIVLVGEDTRPVVDDGSTLITNPGQVTTYQIGFSSNAADYVHDAQFPRMMRVTFLVDGESVTVEVPMLEDLPYQSVDALREAIQSAAQDPESPLYGVIDPNEIGISPGAEEGDDYVLTLQALEAGENAFLITNASLDVPGKAEVKTFAFSDDSSDYFEGGEIHLSIMGYGTVDLPMVARDPVLTLTQAAVSLNELIGENEALANIISKVDVDVVDGGVHLIFTAAHETASALPISAAIDYYGELQTSEINFSSSNSRYYEGGKISVTISVGGTSHVISADMVAGDAIESWNALKTAIEDNENLADVVAEVTVTSSGLKLMAAEPALRSFTTENVSMTIPPQKQVTEVDFSGTSDADFYAFDDEGNPGTISVSIAGQTITANLGDTKAETIQNLADAIEAARTGEDATVSFYNGAMQEIGKDAKPATLSMDVSFGPNGLSGSDLVTDAGIHLWIGDTSYTLTEANLSLDDLVGTIDNLPGVSAKLESPGTASARIVIVADDPETELGLLEAYPGEAWFIYSEGQEFWGGEQYAMGEPGRPTVLTFMFSGFTPDLDTPLNPGVKVEGTIQTVDKSATLSFTPEPGDTLEDLLDYLESTLFDVFGEVQVGYEGNLIVIEFPDKALVFETAEIEGSFIDLENSVEANPVLAEVLGEVSVVSDKLILAAKNPGADPLNVGSARYEGPGEDSLPQIVSVNFANHPLDTAAVDTVLQITISGVTTTYTVTADDLLAPDLSEHLVGKLMDAIIADHADLPNTELGAISREGNSLRITAASNGANRLWDADTGTLLTAVVLRPDTSEIPNAANIDLVQQGVMTWSEHGSGEGIVIYDGGMLEGPLGAIAGTNGNTTVGYYDFDLRDKFGIHLDASDSLGDDRDVHDITDVTSGDHYAPTLDDQSISQVTVGFKGFYQWADHIEAVHAGDWDVINNFQLQQDVITFEGDLLDSLVEGDQDDVWGFNDGHGALFDLSTYEFGFVESFWSELSTTDILDSAQISAVLNNSFEFIATDNGKINTSIFAVTSAEDPHVTAIWAHTQSSSDDDTIEIGELNLLAEVHAIGNWELSYNNFFENPGYLVP